MAIKKSIIALIIALSIAIIPNISNSSSLTDSHVKAAMLIKFTDFIQWPRDSFLNTPDIFIIGVIGDDEIINILNKLKPLSIKNRRLVIVKIDEDKIPQNLHILYVGAKGFYKWEKIKKICKSKHILYVSDNIDFLKNGGIVQFINKKSGKIGFAVNRSLQVRSGLKFSSYLLKLAKIENYPDFEGEKK